MPRPPKPGFAPQAGKAAPRTLARLIAGATLALIVTACRQHTPSDQSTTQDPQNFETIERGAYLTVLGDCAACHQEPGTSRRFAGGRPIETPFGTILAPNITPDRETGIGAWSDADFVNALVAGKGKGGKHLYPAMPYVYFTHITHDDALAMRAYLQTVPAAHHEVVSNQLPFPFDIRASMIGWNALFFTAGAFRPDANKSAEWNRGAYLVEGLGHCGACHTPKNLLGADEASMTLRGYAIQGWFAPAITNDARNGLGGWSVDDIVAYLQSGHNRIAAASGPMAEEIELSSAHMKQPDLRAIAVYLKDGPAPADNAKPLAAEDARMKSGAAIYADECSACHAPDGKGVAGLFPTLNGAPVVQSSDPASLIRVVLEGARSASTASAPTAPAMPAFGWLMTDAQVADVVTYIRNAWGNAAAPVTNGDVRGARDKLARRAD